MPHISEAMQRSVGRGVLDRVGDIVVRSLLGRRSITSEVTNVKDSFSSWDNCMAASYCKWPVIIAIIVVSLIVFSIAWCIIRCACCGMSCCCTCFSFLKCCDCCGGCCDGKKNKPMKHLDDPYPPPAANQGYQAPAPMVSGALNATSPPQYAQFEVGKNGLAVDPKPLSEDALPPMPSWDSASKKRVLSDDDEKNGMELGELNPAGQKVPLMTGGMSPGGMSPGGMSHGVPSPMDGTSPFGARPGQGGNNGYMGVGVSSPGDPYGHNQNAFNQNGRGYGGPQNGPGMGGPGGRYGSPAPQDMNRGYGSPAPQDMNRGYGSPAPQNMNRGYGSPAPQNMGRGGGYGPNSPQDMHANNGFEGAAAGGYGRQPPQRQFSSDSSRPYPPQGPQRQYSGSSARPYPDNQYNNSMPPPNRGPSRGPGGPGRMVTPPPNNISGFDFGIQPQQQQYNTRHSPPPQQMPYGGPQSDARSTPRLEQQQSGNQRGYFDQPGSTAPPSYASRSPPPQEQPAYPGYRPYQPPTSNGASQAVTPGGGGRQPDRWDPVSH